MQEALKIKTIDDLERILIQRPDWKERIRKLILTERLIELPATFDNFRENEFKPLRDKVHKLSDDVDELKQDVAVLKQDVAVLKQDVAVLKQDVAVLKQDVAVLKQDVAVLKQDVAVLKQDVAVLKQDVAELKGDVLEMKFQNKIGAYLGRLISKVRLKDHSELADTLHEALDKGIITEADVDDTLLIDAVAEGYLRKPEPKRVLIAVEVSFVVDKKDILRVLKRADIVFKVYNTECIPVVFGNKITQGARALADQNAVLYIGKR